MSFGLNGDTKELAASKVDIVLKPDMKVARQSINLMSFWNHEIILHDVPIEGTPSTAPS
jgi:hypothetical protein